MYAMVGYRTTTNVESEPDRLLNAVAAAYLKNHLPQEKDTQVLEVLHSMLRRFFRAAAPGSGLEHAIILELGAGEATKEFSQKIDERASRLFGKDEAADGDYQVSLPDRTTHVVCRSTEAAGDNHHKEPGGAFIRYRYIGNLTTEVAEA